MRSLLFHPLGLTLLFGSLTFAGITRFLPAARALSEMAPWVLFWGTIVYTASTVALAWLGTEEGQPSEEDLSESAVVRERLRLDALRHPTTLVAFGLMVVAVCYLVILLPGSIVRLATVAALTLAAAMAAVSFLWLYAVRHRERYAARCRRLTEMLEEAQCTTEREERDVLRMRLEQGFASLGLPKGVGAYRGLEEEFSKLCSVLENEHDSASLSTVAVPALATETYHRGLSVLGDALELMTIFQGASRGRLEGEIVELENEVESSGDDGVQGEIAWIRQDTLASHKHRLVRLDQLRLRADQLLHLAGRCEASLHNTRIEVAAIRAGGSASGVESVVSALQDTVLRAKEVQEELYRLGF